jgi:hypothetical protein
MSVVTDIILVLGIAEPIDELNRYLSDAYNGGALKQVDKHAGGNKAVQCDVYMAAINHFDRESFIRKFASINWNEPECVQLFLKYETEDLFYVYLLNLPPEHFGAGINYIERRKSSRPWPE